MTLKTYFFSKYLAINLVLEKKHPGFENTMKMQAYAKKIKRIALLVVAASRFEVGILGNIERKYISESVCYVSKIC